LNLSRFAPTSSENRSHTRKKTNFETEIKGDDGDKVGRGNFGFNIH